MLRKVQGQFDDAEATNRTTAPRIDGTHRSEKAGDKITALNEVIGSQTSSDDGSSENDDAYKPVGGKNEGEDPNILGGLKDAKKEQDEALRLLTNDYALTYQEISSNSALKEIPLVGLTVD